MNAYEQIAKDVSTPTDEAVASTSADGLPKELRFQHDHPKELIIGDNTTGIHMCSSFNLMCNVAFLSILEPRTLIVLWMIPIGLWKCRMNCHNSIEIEFGTWCPDPKTQQSLVLSGYIGTNLTRMVT